MRIKAWFKRKEGNGRVTSDYRRYFISLLKGVFERENPYLYSELYSSKVEKPFTFSVYLGKNAEISKSEVKCGEKIHLIFSTGEHHILVSLLNGLLSMHKEEIPFKFGENIYTVDEITVLRPVKIMESEVRFITLGAVVLTDSSARASDFNKWFVVPNAKDILRFNSVLTHRVIDKFRRVKGKEVEGSLSLKAISSSAIEEVMIRHYGGYLRGWRGKFILSGPPELLQFVYDYGLGVRTGQGFGCLDICDED